LLPQNQFDAIDLSDNEIVKLEGFPPLTRLHSLNLSNNRIARIGNDLQVGPARHCPPRFPPR
jgi:U2 small nuclear ribonucleoprotein A'